MSPTGARASLEKSGIPAGASVDWHSVGGRWAKWFRVRRWRWCDKATCPAPVQQQHQATHPIPRLLPPPLTHAAH